MLAVVSPPDILTSSELEEFGKFLKASTIVPPSSPDILGPTFTLENIISSYIFYSLRPMILRDSVSPWISKKAHNHPYRNYLGSSIHDSTDIEVSGNRWFIAIAGSQHVCYLSESSTYAIWKYSPKLVKLKSLIFQPDEINGNGELQSANQHVHYFHIHSPQLFPTLNLCS